MCASEAEEQAAWPVLVVRVVFDNLAIRDGFTKLLHTNATEDACVDCMLRELKQTAADLVANPSNHVTVTLNGLKSVPTSK